MSRSPGHIVQQCGVGLFRIRRDGERLAFVAGLDVPEDPVTGSLNAGLAIWLIDAGVIGESYVVSQGAALQRRGRVFIDKIESDIWIRGDVAIRIEGQVRLACS